VGQSWKGVKKVSIFDARGMKVRVGIGASMQSHVINRVTLFATSLNSHAISDRDVVNILSYFGLP
jgi:hypothetical protein